MTTNDAVLHENDAVSKTEAARLTDALTPLVPDRTNAAQIEIRTLVQLLEGVGVELADKALAALQNDGWEVLDISVNTVVEYERVGIGSHAPRLRTVRTVTLMRLLDGDESSQEADAAADATATVQIPTIVLTPPEPEHMHLTRTIVGRGVTFAQASADGTYTEGELDALRQFEQMAAFVPVRTQ